MGHTYDLMFFELFKVCFWWLPTVWFINKEIRKIHEYQADAYALKSYNVDQYSSILISSTVKSNGLSLASSFHDGLILKRLIAMKQEAKNVRPWKLGVLSALGALLFIVFACSEEQNQEIKETDPQTNIIKPKIKDDALTVLEERPVFEGGMDAFYNYVGEETKYPAQAQQMGVEGHVFVQFVIEKDGSLSNVRVIKGIGAGCDREAVRVVQNARAFKPGKQRGKPVRVRMVMPITFKLKEGKANEDNGSQGIIIVEEAKIIGNKLKVDTDYTNGEWSGTVYDGEGKGLPGASIIVAGTPIGTITDIDGNFKLKADKSKDLIINFVGYESVRLEGK